MPFLAADGNGACTKLLVPDVCMLGTVRASSCIAQFSLAPPCVSAGSLVTVIKRAGRKSYSTHSQRTPDLNVHTALLLERILARDGRHTLIISLCIRDTLTALST